MFTRKAEIVRPDSAAARWLMERGQRFEQSCRARS
jgi:hypothetical protein